MLFFPMDSVRYFEFDFIWRALMAGKRITRYLDVSSPRMFPIVLLNSDPSISGELLNPDPEDLRATEEFIAEYGLAGRVKLNSSLITDASIDPSSFDALTCISVLEHIPEDGQAVEAMWRLLRSGGRMFLSVPCAAESFEEFIDFNGYGLLEPDENGFYFSQRFYDEVMLRERILSVTGEPVRSSIYGEVRPGMLVANRAQKFEDPDYPVWREPYMMAEQFRYFDSISSLPGCGVIAMEFVKA